MMLTFDTIATGLFGLFVTIGSLLLLIFKNKKAIAFLFTKRDRACDLSSHFIFFEIQSWRDYQIDFKCSRVACPVRSSLSRKFLQLRFEVKEEYYMTLVEKIKKEKLTFRALAAEKAKMEDEFYDRALAIGIPEIVLLKFDNHISQSEIANLYLYERILQYSNFRTDEDKLSAIFCVDLKDMYVAGKDIELVIMSLNGEIDKAIGTHKN